MGEITKKIVDGHVEGSAIKSYCNECGADRNHTILKSIRIYVSEVVAREMINDNLCEHTVDGSNEYLTLQCMGCEDISFMREHWFSEDEHDPYYGTVLHHKFYPPRSNNLLNGDKLDSVPINLKGIYSEVVDCFNNSSFILCAVGLRTLIEGICSEQGVDGGNVFHKNDEGETKPVRSSNLDGKIEGLHEKGILTKNHAEILNTHRFLGNEAVHQLRAPHKNELETAINILEHLIDSLYVIPQKGIALKEMMTKRKKTN
ncbi:MAG: DUF4145 domain-containing protein [Rhodospirillales bacterium]|nr:DUF4145 domain-containing protein [Rhodospirillales bacterium]